MDLWGEIAATMELLELALSEAKERGHAYAEAEAAYYTAKAQAAFALKEQGMAVGLISAALKGVPEVNGALTEKTKREVEYRNANEALQAYKLRLRVLEAQYEREWGQAGRGV